MLGYVVDQGFSIDLAVPHCRPGAQRAGADLCRGRPPTNRLERGYLVPRYGVVVHLQGMRYECVLLVELDGINAGEAYPGFGAFVVLEQVRLPSFFRVVEDLGFRAVG